MSAYINIHNDAGNYTYFQADSPVIVNGTELNFFYGASAGSEENPDYCVTDELALINLGVTASREIGLSESFSLPLTVGFILNPKAGFANLLVGVSFYRVAEKRASTVILSPAVFWRDEESAVLP